MQTNDTPRFLARVCERCSKPFLLPIRFAGPGRGRFCTNDCSWKWRKEHAGTVRTCARCGKEFRRRGYRDDIYCGTDCAAKARRVDLETRFWAKAEKTETCWLWTASKHLFGYGKIYAGGKPRDAHRVSWEMHFGPIPAGLKVLHNCPDGNDNPACVNPAHLYLGTDLDNTRDCIQKGRRKARGPAAPPPPPKPPPKTRPRGESHCGAKLTEPEIREMRTAWQNRTATQPELAARYRVTQATVSDIVLYKSWRHVE